MSVRDDRAGGGLIHYALAPWWLLQLGTSAKSFIDNPLIGSRRLNALGLHGGRVRLAAAMADRRRRRLAGLVTAEDRAAFARDGFVLRRNALPSDEFARLRDTLLGYAGDARETLQGNAITRRLAIDPAMRAAVPEVVALLDGSLWHGLTRYVSTFASEPVASVQTIRAHARPGAEDPQTELHADTFHATMKAWLFLTDVAEENGPFCYVPGSHVQTPERMAWEDMRATQRGGPDQLSGRGSLRISAAELDALGLPAPHRFAVPANTLIVADTSGFHGRGIVTRPSLRAEIWGYTRRNPFLPWTGFDLLSLPGIAERRIVWNWWYQDQLHPRIGRQWHPIGRVTPLDPSPYASPA